MNTWYTPEQLQQYLDCPFICMSCCCCCRFWLLLLISCFVQDLCVVWNPTYLLTFISFCLLTLSRFVQSVLDRTFTLHYCIFYFTDIFVIILWYFIIVFVLHVYGICAARRTFCSFSLSSVLSSHHLRPDVNTAFEWQTAVSVSVRVFVCLLQWEHRPNP